MKLCDAKKRVYNVQGYIQKNTFHQGKFLKILNVLIAYFFSKGAQIWHYLRIF